MGNSQQSFSRLLQNPTSYPPIQYGSINPPYLATNSIQPEVMEGAIVSGKMSVSRRFFVLLTVFDILFTSLLWIICTVTSYDTSLASAFEREVVNYNITSSVFDVVILAAIRGFFILLFYALLRISHWWVIACTTSGSGIFIVAKVLVYNWSQAASKTASVVLVLYSFVISWVEAWFLDCRVVPNEAKAADFFVPPDTDQTIIVPHSALSRSQSDDGSAFYSPPGSDGEDDSIKDQDGSIVSEVEWVSSKNAGQVVGQPSEQEYRKVAQEALSKALNIINSEGWAKEKTGGSDVIYTKFLPEYGKVYKLVGIINTSPEKVIDELFYKAENMHKWNPTVKRVQIIQKIDSQLDVSHVISTEGAAGLVASRDFVNVRIWEKMGDSYVHALCGTTHNNMPESSKYVRGEHGPSMYVLKSVDGDSNKCALQWLLNANLRGWLPQYLIDQALSTVMLDYVKALRKQTINE